MVVYRYIGSAVTDSKGIAHLDYTGSGAGELDIIASSSNPISSTSILSDVYEVDDCYFIETGSSTSGYNLTNGTLTLTNGVFTLTKSSSSGSALYTNFPKTDYPITDFQGMTLIVKADVISMSATQLRMSLFYNVSGSWSNAVVHDLTTVGTMEQSIDIPSDATQVRIRFDLTGNENDSVVFKDLRLLWG